mmetsp:Transcript_19248/g.36097  ORF Transcript_19248/g.36097 Transcript_19248/m.36097 type:complete len:156 (+) Transcript_19248:27-494(+)
MFRVVEAMASRSHGSHSRHVGDSSASTAKLFGNSAPCPWDGDRRAGCAHGCSCGWTERCYPSYQLFAGNATAAGTKLLDVGACGVDHWMPVAIAFLLPIVLLTCLLSVRRSLTSFAESDLKPDGGRKRMDALCNKDGDGARSVRRISREGHAAGE